MNKKQKKNLAREKRIAQKARQEQKRLAIEKAQEKARRENVGSIQFHVMDAESLDFEDNTFDIVCVTGIIHHINIEKAYQEIARTLKPAGSAIL